MEFDFVRKVRPRAFEISMNCRPMCLQNERLNNEGPERCCIKDRTNSNAKDRLKEGYPKRRDSLENELKTKMTVVVGEGKSKGLDGKANNNARGKLQASSFLRKAPT